MDIICCFCVWSLRVVSPSDACGMGSIRVAGYGAGGKCFFNRDFGNDSSICEIASKRNCENIFWIHGPMVYLGGWIVFSPLRSSRAMARRMKMFIETVLKY